MVDEKDKQRKSMKGDRQMDAMKTARYPHHPQHWMAGGWSSPGMGRHVKWEIAVVHWPEMIQ